MIQQLSGLYHNALEEFSKKEKIEILGKLKIPTSTLRGIDYEDSIINEQFLSHINQFIKDFFFTSKRDRAFRHHLGKYEQFMYSEIWKKNEQTKQKKGKYNLRDATFKVLKREDPNLTDNEKEKYYDKVKKFMNKHNIKSFANWKIFLGNIGGSP